MINKISNLSFCGKIYVRDGESRSLGEALDEMSNVLTNEEKNEFAEQLRIIQREIKDKNIDISIDGCPSTSSTGELRIALRQANGFEHPSVYFVPEEKENILFGCIPTRRMFFYNKDEIHKLASELLKQTREYPKDESDSPQGKLLDIKL